MFDVSKMTSVTTAVNLRYFRARRVRQSGVVGWAVRSQLNHKGFHVARESEDGTIGRITSELLSGKDAYKFVDDAAPNAATKYWLEEIETGGASRWYGPALLPKNTNAAVTSLQNASPNPFNGGTTIRFTLAQSARAVIDIYDVAGRLVRTLVDEEKAPGVTHAAVWDGHDGQGRPVASGVYFYQLVAGNFKQTKKLVFLK